MRPRPLLLVLLTLCAALAPTLNAAPASTRPTSAKADAKAGARPVVAIFELDTPIMEQSSADAFPFGPQPVSLRELVRRLNHAADDEKLKAVVLLADRVRAGPGQVEELRQAIARVRAKDKEVFVHSDSMQFGEYVLFSGASRISVVPGADLWVNGVRVEGVFLRGLLDKIGVKGDFEHVGAWKSASEMFTRDAPSPEADAMMNWLVDSLYGSMVDLIAQGRKVSPDQVRQWIDQGPFNAEQARSAGVIDAVEHRQDFDAMLKQKFGQNLAYDRRYGAPRQPQLDFNNPFAMFQIFGEILGGGQRKQPSTRPTIGIVHVDGPIMPGSGKGSIFGSAAANSTEIRNALDDAARDNQVKAVVLRVDSPGGSAVASEIILDATKRVRAKKPLVVSMGNVAGSGGYYVACGAETIFADRMTLTASIGVVGGKLVTTEMWNKVGVTFKPYSRGANAGILASDHAFTDPERQHMRQWMESIYDTFKGHVTEARKDKLKKPIDELAQGRVFTGQQALELGLVDKIGTLDDAIRFAAERAGVSDYDVRTVPQPKNFIEKLMEEGAGSERDSKWVAGAAGAAGAAGPLFSMALPYLKGLDPVRVDAVRSALSRLELLGQEGVIVTMPGVFLPD
ncbi:MAG TPA: signal peptide peptidase SppA [Tepidisphaeraceae bacterium]|nr:signal peptide peptidase SppA [Tepidisphaeraceae bacterium]